MGEAASRFAMATGEACSPVSGVCHGCARWPRGSTSILRDCQRFRFREPPTCRGPGRDRRSVRWPGTFTSTCRRPEGDSLTVAGKAGRWTLQYRQALAGETLAELRLTTVLHGADLRRSRLYGVVDVSSQDVAALLRQLRESVIPVPAVVDVVRSGQVTARGTVAGSIGEPVVDLLVSASDVSAGDVDAIRVAGAVHADRRQIVLKPLAVDTAAAHLEMRGSIGFARMESTGEFDVRIDGPGRLAPIVPAEWRPTGSIAAKGSWSGRLDRPRVSARLTGEELIANGLHFESLAGDVEVVDDELLVHDVRLSQRNGQLRVDGRYNIRERALSTTVEGRGLRVTLRRLWSPASDESPQWLTPTWRACRLTCVWKARCYGHREKCRSPLTQCG